MRFIKTGIFPVLCIPAVAIIALVGCGKASSQADKATSEGILLMGNKVEPSSLDPQLTTSVEEANIEWALFEGLLGPDPKTLQPSPALAERFEVSTDGLIYTFHIRTGAKWSDGTPVTSNDFVVSWKRLLSPQLASLNATLLHCVKGAKAFNEGKSTDFSTVGVSAPDPQTLVVTLESATPWFTSILMHPATYALPISFIEKCGALTDRTSGWTRKENFPSGGPFKIAKWQPGSMIEVAKNPSYWDAQAVRLNAIRFFPIDSANVEETAFRGGQLHITDTVPVGKIAAMLKTGDRSLRIDPYLGIYYYSLNTARKPLDNPDVRMALSLAIDRDAITQKLLGGAQKSALSFVPGAIDGYEPPKVVTTDITRARALLAKAGYPDGAGFPKMELLFNTSENHRMIAEAVQAMWKANLGIEVELRNEDFNSYLGTRTSGNFDILRAGWVADYPAAASFLDLLLSNSSNNFAGWKNAKYDAIMEKSRSATSDRERAALYREAETLMLGEAPIIPIYVYNTTRLIRPEVEGWDPNVMDWHPYKYVSLKEPTNK
jgi:oligopeptide transport system substrate-binding protein